MAAGSRWAAARSGLTRLEQPACTIWVVAQSRYTGVVDGQVRFLRCRLAGAMSGDRSPSASGAGRAGRVSGSRVARTRRGRTAGGDRAADTRGVRGRAAGTDAPRGRVVRTRTA